MKQVSLLLGFLFLFMNGFAQGEIENYIKRNVIQIKNVDPDSRDFEDLENIAKAIGNRRIVMLGELFHGDGTTFLAKSRLVKYLHEKLGFNVIAFESDFFALNDGWEQLEKNRISIDSMIKLSIFPIWTACKQSKAVFDYIRDQSKADVKLRLTGFDSQLASPYSMRYLGTEIKRFLDSLNIPFILNSDQQSHFLSLVNVIVRHQHLAPIVKLDSLIAYSEIILQELKHSDVASGFNSKVIKNISVFCSQLSYYKKNNKDLIGASTLRDSQMAENLKWLATYKYPNEKIIVWAHNGHIWKNSDSLFNGKFKVPYSMGYYFTRDNELSKQTYILGFTEYSWEGKFTTQHNRVKVTKPAKNSLEQWLKKAKYPFSFIDFTKFVQENPENKEQFYMKTYIDSQAKSYWHKIFDGIFFIEEMVPCEIAN